MFSCRGTGYTAALERVNAASSRRYPPGCACRFGFATRGASLSDGQPFVGSPAEYNSLPRWVQGSSPHPAANKRDINKPFPNVTRPGARVPGVTERVGCVRHFIRPRLLMSVGRGNWRWPTNSATAKLNQQTREWLDREWEAAQKQHDLSPDDEIDKLVKFRVRSIRYVLFTQVLGCVENRKRSTTALKPSASGLAATWTPRQFCKDVVVPWSDANQKVLGKSRDPYASNPLRRDRLTAEMPGVRDTDRSAWRSLYEYLAGLDHLAQKELKNEFRRILRSLVRWQREQMPRTSRTSEIMRTIQEGLNRLAVDRASSDAAWTRAVKTKLCEIGRDFNYRVGASKLGHFGEFLYDVTWLEYEYVGDPISPLIDVHLVAECEWKSFEFIIEDFEKLLLARASVRLMIFNGNFKPGPEKIAAQLAERIRAFKGTRDEDAWLLAAFEGLDDGRWRFRYFPVEGATSLINLSKAENPDFHA